MRPLLAALPVMLALALPAAATPPLPMITMELEWREPETVVIRIESQLGVEYQATLFVTTGEYGEKKICEEPIRVVHGRTERAVTVPITRTIQQIGVRVMTPDSGLLLVERLHIGRDGAGKIRVIPPIEIEDLQAARREAMRARAKLDELERMRNHVQRVLARGGRPICSAESPPTWNQAVVDVLGEEAPAVCRELVGTSPPD